MKIMIMGSAGAGKSTVARKLGEVYDVPVFHLDQCFWKPGWVMSTPEEQTEIHDKLMEKDDWIIDGNYSAFFETRAEHADKIIYLNVGRWQSFYRVLKRYFLNRGKTRIDMAEGCEEKLDWEFLVWIWNYHSKDKYKWMEKLESIEDREVIILQNTKALNEYLSNLKEEQWNSKGSS